MRPRRLLALLGPLTLLLAACQSAPPAAPQTARYTLVYLVRAANAVQRTDAERKEIQAGHMANMGRLAEEGRLFIAGPFGQPNPDERLRGIFVLATGSNEEAQRWVATDPAVIAGTLAPELASFESSPELRRAKALDDAMKAEARQAGRELELKDSIRGYVMLQAQEAAAAQRALDGLAGVIFAGTVGGTPRARYLAVLDAADVAAAETLLGERRAALGEHVLQSWWASKALVGLRPEPAHSR